MKKIPVYLEIMRPLNVLIGMFSIVMGAFLSGTLRPLSSVLLAALAGGLIAGAAKAINDYFGIEIDRVNKPNLPLPSGRLLPKAVYAFSMSLFGCGCLIATVVNWMTFLVAVFSSILLYAYSARLKRTILWGNLTVSLITALAFVFGGVAVNHFGLALIPAGFAFFFNFGREIIKDVQDMPGDAADDAVTYPIYAGRGRALLLATLIFGLLILGTFVPWWLNVYGVYYLVAVVVGVDLVILFLLGWAWYDSSPRNLGRVSDLLKIDMLVGLFALWLGRF